jgi:cell growth-regulating nucleolar protein
MITDLIAMQPKVGTHVNQCSASSFTCIDCSRQFDQTTVHSHTQCVTEHEKYAKGATKPGGFAEKGFYAKSDTNSGEDVGMQAVDEVTGAQFLSTFAPWKCSICNVTCTSRETLLGHAQGAKHKRRSKAALGATIENGMDNGDDGNPHTTEQNGHSKVDKENNNADKQDDPETKLDEGQVSKDVKKDKKVKWKSLAISQLKRSNGEMKIKKLIAAIKAASGDAGAESDYVLRRLKKAKKLEFDGKIIRLKSN